MLDINEEGCKKEAAELNEKAGKKCVQIRSLFCETKISLLGLQSQSRPTRLVSRVNWQHMNWAKKLLEGWITVMPLSSAHFQNLICTFVVFANAGIAEHPWLPSFDPSTASSHPIIEPDTETLDVNLNGQLNTAALAFQVFERQQPNPRTGFRGKLVMTASVYGYWSCKSMPMYAAAKAGVVNFVRGLARYYGDKGVTVNMGKCFLLASGVEC